MKSPLFFPLSYKDYKVPKHIFITILSVGFITTASNCQNTEFKIHNNGLIYSDATMQQLTGIVDSLNLKFKRCDLNKTYYSVSQATGYYISLEKEKGNVKEAVADIKKDISLEDFMKKYKGVVVDSNILIIKNCYRDDYNKKWITVFTGQLGQYGDPQIEVKGSRQIASYPEKKWIYDFYEDLQAFFILQPFISSPIPEKYARMILYADCIVDTTADIFIKKKNDDIRNRFSDDNSTNNKLTLFNQYLEKKTKHITEKDVPAAYKDYKWLGIDSMKKAWIKENLVHTERFKQLLADATEESKEKNITTSDEFEAYVAKYISKADALEMKRSRRVIGGCSMDQSPRYHALNIALLSAETVNWEIFLRAHLNIMNDRFERNSDGSWAWAQRNTYIKELEDLNIDVHDLLLGISLRIENPADKHYYGSISRLGRALAETKDRQQLEEEVLGAIKDNQLDAYNRLLMHYLYLNYIYYLPKKSDRLNSLEKLEEADKTLPLALRSRIQINKKDFEIIQ